MNFHTARTHLQHATASPPDASLWTILIRTAVTYPEAAELLVKRPLKTRQQRYDATIECAAVIAA